MPATASRRAEYPGSAQRRSLRLISEPAETISGREESFQGMVGRSAEIHRVFWLIQRIAPHFHTALIFGETGTGKELVARALHDLSPSQKGQFVTLNCSAVVESLFESELFGHVRGAFTGAFCDKMGLFEFANGGTLFLDEIGDMPLATQAKLLRALENREVQRVGSLISKKVDVRVVAATNKDLRAAVAARTFREDLYYRLTVVEINVPPLRERTGDVRHLVSHMLREASKRFDRPPMEAPPQVLEVLMRHCWPGNVRELENVVGHACMMAQGETLEMGDLPTYLWSAGGTPAGVDESRISLPAALHHGAADVIEDFEIRLIRQALCDAHGNQIRAARLLRTTRDRLRYRMKKYRLRWGAGELREAVRG